MAKVQLPVRAADNSTPGINYNDDGDGLTQFVRLDSGGEPLPVTVQTVGGAVAYARLTELASPRALQVPSLITWGVEGSGGVAFERGRVTRTANTPSGWVGGASSDSLGASGTGRVTAVPTRSPAGAGRAVIGLNGAQTTLGAAVDWGFLVDMNPGEMFVRKLYEAGSVNQGPDRPWSPGDTVSVGVEGGAVTYWHNDEVVHVSPTPPTGTLYVAARLSDDAIGHSITAISTVGDWTGGEPAPGSGWARVFVEQGEIRFRDDGVPASTTGGALWGAGSYFETHALDAASLVEVVPGSIVTVEFY